MSGNASVCEDPRSPAEDVTVRVRLTLNQSHMAFQNVRVKEENGAIVLTGWLPSFYLKQIAQTVASSVAGVRRVENRTEVVRTSRLTA